MIIFYDFTRLYLRLAGLPESLLGGARESRLPCRQLARGTGREAPRLTDVKEDLKEISLVFRGQEDLSFSGSLLTTESDQWINGQEQNRWNEYSLYRTAAGAYIIVSEYITLWQGERCSKSYEVFDNKDALIEHAKGEGGMILDLVKDVLPVVRKIE